MKKILLSIGILLASFSAVYAQDEIDQFQKEWGKEKKDLVRMAMELSPADSVKFWPLYDKYEKERQKLGKDRIKTFSDYADNLDKLTNTKADELINRLFVNDAGVAKLRQKYYSSIKTTLNALQAAKFMQIETYFDTAIRSAIQDELPYIGDLESIKKQ
jgi:hypothetical protein